MFLNEYCLNGLSESEFDQLMESLNNKELSNYIQFSSSRCNKLVTINMEYSNVKKVIQLLCRSEPVTGLFQFSILDNNQKKNSCLPLSNSEPTQEETLIPIFQKMHTLEWLLKSLPFETDSEGFITLHQSVSSLLKSILTKIENLFKYPTRKLVKFYPETNEYHNYFPTFSTNFK